MVSTCTRIPGLTGVPADAIRFSMPRKSCRKLIFFSTRIRGSVADFANFFRYKLSLEKGGWWTDMDYVCLTPLDFADDLVFGSEMDRGERFYGKLAAC